MTRSRSKIVPRSRLLGEGGGIDTLRETRAMGADGGAMEVLRLARDCWDSLRTIRANRARCYRYTYGDQWGDEVQGFDAWCRRCTEREAIQEDGNEPLTNNLIAKMVRTAVSVYRNQNKIPVVAANDRDEQSLSDAVSTVLMVNWRVNHKKELDAVCFKDFLIGGVAVQKEEWGWNGDAERPRKDAWSFNREVNRMFWDPDAVDVRGWDLNIIGELKDLTFPELCSRYAHSRGDVGKLRAIYHRCKDQDLLLRGIMGASQREDRLKLSSLDFLMPYDTGKCRVIEVWTKEARHRYHVWDPLEGTLEKCEAKDVGVYEAENALRLAEGLAAGMVAEEVPLIELEEFVDTFWYYRHLSPLGDVLDEGETPYDHKSHPYSLKLYPMVGNEVRSLVSDVIDQQRYINRLISLNDKLIRSSAKGVLMYPLSMLPDEMTREEVEAMWNSPDSVMFYDDEKSMRSGAKPEQIANRLTNIGIDGLLSLEMNLVEEITGVNGALQGKPGFAGQSATLYAQQTQNASTALLDLLESFEDMILRGATKKVKNIQQFYTPEQWLQIAGRGSQVEIDPTLCGDVDCDLTIYESVDTPVARSLNNDLLMQLFQLGAINVKQLLENGSFPFGDSLLASIRAEEEAMAQQQMMQQAQGGGALPQEPPQGGGTPDGGGQSGAAALHSTRRAMGNGGGNVDPWAQMQAERLARYPILSRGDAMRMSRGER